MNAHFFSTKVVRLMLVPLLVCGLLVLVALSLSGAAVNAAPLRSYGSDPQLRWITVTASGGVVVSDTQPGEVTSSSKIVYFSDLASGTITVTPDVTGTASPWVTRAKGLDGKMLVVSATAAPLIKPMPDGPLTLVGSQDVTFTLERYLGTLLLPGSWDFTLNFKEDILPPTAGITAPATAGQVLTRPTYTIVMTAADGGSGIQSVQISTGGAAQTGVASGNGQWMYTWTLPLEDSVLHTLLMTATDYVGNYTTVARLITVDTQGPIITGVALTPSHSINTWLPASTIVMTWTGVFSDASEIGSYRYLWDTSDSTVITPGMNVSSTANTTAAQLLSTNGNYYFHVAALDTNSNWSGTVVTGPFKIDTVAPTSGSLSINNGALNTNQVTVTLTVSATDTTNSLSQMAFSDNGTTWVTSTYAATATWNLPAGDGLKTVHARFTDVAGNISVNASDTITLDQQAPTGGSVSINNGAFNTNQVTVTLTVGAVDATSGLNEMAFSNDGTTWTTQPYATTAAWTLTDGEGPKTVYARFTDNAGNVSGKVSDTITLDLVAPMSTINLPANGAFYNSLTSITGTANAVGGSDVQKVEIQIISGTQYWDGATWITSTAWLSTTGTTTWSRVSGLPTWVNGQTYTVTSRATDTATNVETPAPGNTFTYDTVAPTGGSVSINSGALNTNQVTVTLTVSATDATSGLNEMAFSNDGTTWLTYTYAASAAWTLTSGDSTKTVYARFTDKAGNVSVNVSDTITLDMTAPQGGNVSINNGALNTHQVTVTLTVSATDATSGLNEMTFSNDGTTWLTYTYAATATWALTTGDGLKTVYARFTDIAGNVSGKVSDTITLDTVAPTGSVAIDGHAAYANQVTVTLALSVIDETSGVSEMRLSNDGATWPSGWETFTTTKTWTLDGASDGLKTVYAQLRDAATNVNATPYTATIFLDRIAPQATLTLPHQVSAAQVVAEWTGFDPGYPSTGSGINSYSLSYVRDDGYSAQYTLPATATTTIVPVTSEHTYIFTLNAYDKAGNYITTQQIPLRVGPFKVHLPIVLNNYLNCIPIDTEPNNDYTHAQSLTNWSNISGGRKLTASGNFCPSSATTLEDQADYFTITPANNSLSLKLSMPAGTNLNLYGYDQSGANLVFSAIAPAGNKSVDVLLPAGSGAPYYLKIQRMDAVFNQSHAQPYTLEVSDLKTLTNGSFEDGAGNTVTDWELSNHELPAAPVTNIQDGTVLFGNRAVLLGNRDLGCDSIPIGYAEAQQTFFVPNVPQSLSLKYRYVIFTGDAPGATPEKYDRFEVYVQNATTPVATDGNKVNRLTCNLRRVPGDENPRPQDGTWAVNSVSLDAYKGQSVTVIFRNYNRFDNRYNTFTYLDKVELVSP